MKTAREIAKDFLRPYVLRGDSLEYITYGNMTYWGRDFHAQIGGIVFPHDNPHKKKKDLTRYQLAVTQIEGHSCFAVFDVQKLVDEMRNGEQVSLWQEASI